MTSCNEVSKKNNAGNMYPLPNKRSEKEELFITFFITILGPIIILLLIDYFHATIQGFERINGTLLNFIVISRINHQLLCPKIKGERNKGVTIPVLGLINSRIHVINSATQQLDKMSIIGKRVVIRTVLSGDLMNQFQYKTIFL